MKLLFVSNGHGEIAIANRIAQDVERMHPGTRIDHLALVGQGVAPDMHDVGPRRTMPSGGLIAMGNLPNIMRDLRGGLLALTFAQRRFLIRARGAYDGVTAVGDVYALLMALAARTSTVYVGTAKSVLVAPYGPMERRVLRRARAVFVRDEATAKDLRRYGIDARAPGNVIVDLFASEPDEAESLPCADFAPAVAIFPGSRESAYRDAVFLLDVLRRCLASRPHLGALLSIAPLLDAARFAAIARDAGFEVEASDDDRVAFEGRMNGRVALRAWRGSIGTVLARVALVIGQAGTANEAAAAAGIPVVALELGHDRKTAWYRMRQHGLLGEALRVVPGQPQQAAREIGALLDDAALRNRMGMTGRERMGPRGGAAAIAQAIVACAS